MTQTFSAVLHGAKDIRLEKRPVPRCQQNEVLIRMKNVGICGSDVHYYSHGRIGEKQLLAPIVIGHEASGLVAEVGSEVTNLFVGDRVAIEPGYSCRVCEFCKCGRYNLCPKMLFCAAPPVHGNLTPLFAHPADFCHKLPEKLNFEEGALVEPLGVAVAACLRADIQIGDTLLICGAGPIGVLNYLVANAMGASHICLTDINQKRLDFARTLGAKRTLLVESGQSPKAIAHNIETLVLDGKPNKVIECTGVPSSICTAIYACRPSGCVMQVGIPPPLVHLPVVHAAVREIDIRGVFRYANCTYEDFVGQWFIFETDRGYSNDINCTEIDDAAFTHVTVVELHYPDVAVDIHGNIGYWTLIYNQGLEITLNNRVYFAFSEYMVFENTTLSLCDMTKIGWAHDSLIRDWSCFLLNKLPDRKSNDIMKRFGNEKTLETEKPNDEQLYSFDQQKINTINTVQKDWQAGVYDDWQHMTVGDINQMRGGPTTAHTQPRKQVSRSSALSEDQQRDIERLPKKFDWRDVNGMNFVSPVRDQGGCGSCYAFGSMAMLEARYRILTNNTQTPVFSTNDIVQCSQYSQGCAGGFPYLIAGKYAQDFGVVLEEDNPYSLPEPNPVTCQTKPNARRYYATDYKYVGGFYGGCNEALMKLALVKNGPIAVSFEVYNDFELYKGGVYHHVDLKNHHHEDPFEITNHVVVVVGYGYDEKVKQDYWIVKNSWGKNWGEDGYFRIRRGNDECSIESIAVESTPIVTYANYLDN